VNLVTGLNPQCSWDFGDGIGTNLSGLYPSYTYANIGTYNVCLTVTTDNCSNTFCDSLTIDSLGIIGKYAMQGFTINVFSPQELVNGGNQNGIKTLDSDVVFKVYPNPTNDELYFETSFKIEDLRFKILDVLGNDVMTVNSPIENSTPKAFGINIQHLKSGLYYIKTNNAEVLKFIKE
jgi:PKD repeat protein